MAFKLMIGKLIVGAAATAALGVAVAAEPVGKVARIQGTGVVSQGAQYVTVREGMTLREGDRLMAFEGGAITIQYADGCRFTLTENDVLTVGAVSTCAANAVGTYQIDPKSGVAQGQSPAGYLRQAALEPPTPPPPPPVVIPAAGFPWAAAAVSAAVVGGVIIANNNDDDREPISR